MTPIHLALFQPEPPAPCPTALQLAALITAYRYGFACETDLQNAIAVHLTINAIDFQREAPLTEHDRPDFLVGSIAVEVKIHDAYAKVLRQLHRYAQHPQVDAIVLVTTKAAHLRIPRQLNGKPVLVASLLGGAF